ncbi:hypothetical protein [Streptosporangium sp. NPDC000396]|uniref:hypothetical protein n=1 Tax=Streptosporangium sp. NPDC000396 TaxID=3366185 RepID=UPI00368DFCD4
MRLHDGWLAGVVGAVMLTAFVGEPAAMGATETAAPQPSCTAPPLPGHVVDVKLVDGGSGMASGSPSPYGSAGPHGTVSPSPSLDLQNMGMSVVVTPAKVAAGTVSLRVYNTGVMAHELAVLPLASGQKAGDREVGSDDRIDEAGSLGKASRDCAAGAGEGIAPHSMSWVTLTLRPGRYELVCNFPGHYARGMRAELDVTG